MVQEVATNKQRISVYLSKDLKAKLDAIADVDDRSLNNLIEVALKFYVASREEKND